MEAPIMRALAALPPPVLWYVSRSCVVLGVGWSTRGTFYPAKFKHPRTIVVCGASHDARQVSRTTLHEVGHAYTLPCGDRSGRQSLTNAEERHIGEVFDDRNWLVAHRRQAERWANVLAELWAKGLEEC